MFGPILNAPTATTIHSLLSSFPHFTRICIGYHFCTAVARRARRDQERRSSRGKRSGDTTLLVMSAESTPQRQRPCSVRSSNTTYTIKYEVDGAHGQQANGVFVVQEVGAEKEWALKLFDLNNPGRKLVFERETTNLESIDKLRQEGKGAFPHIIQPKEVFEDERWGCIIMPLGKSLTQHM